jgi:hypothetical protein
MAVPWCAEISSFLCRSLGRVKPFIRIMLTKKMDRLERKFAENDIICCARKIQP